MEKVIKAILYVGININICTSVHYFYMYPYMYVYIHDFWTRCLQIFTYQQSVIVSAQALVYSHFEMPLLI